jgi:hypothetical protein
MATQRDREGKARFFDRVADKEAKRGNHVMAGLLRNVARSQRKRGA